MKKVNEKDELNLSIIRTSVTSLIREASKNDIVGIKVLDIAPQDHNGAKEFFKHATIDTLDIDPKSNATYIANLCVNNSALIPDNFYDIVICTEVLEHTLNPFDATSEIFRVLKVGGICFASTPFNLRIHGPLPDCWRFTEYGLRSIFSKFSKIEIKEIEDVDRFLMPVHYQIKVIK